MLKNLFNKDKSNIGLPPGTIVISQPDKPLSACEFSISKIAYNEFSFEKESIDNFEKLKSELENIHQDQVTWINIDSSEPLIVNKIGEILNLHPLVQEDIVNTHQRPKFEDWDDYLYITIKMLSWKESSYDQEQVSFILGKNYIISFQERPGDIFDVIRKRLINNKGRIRRMQADYLLYSLLDSITDQYYVVLNKISEDIESLEEIVNESPDTSNLKRVQQLKQELLIIRRFILPVKELILALIKAESELLGQEVVPFLRDLQDHTSQVIESVEVLRDFMTNIKEIANSALSNKMNEIMKVLTIVSTIFIPITFVAGIYGMNFDIPELKWQYGYPAVLALMFTTMVSMLIYFKNKKWL